MIPNRTFTTVTAIMLGLLTVGMGVMVYLYAQIPRTIDSRTAGPVTTGTPQPKAQENSEVALKDIQSQPDRYRGSTYTVTGTVVRGAGSQWLLQSQGSALYLDLSGSSEKIETYANQNVKVTGKIDTVKVGGQDVLSVRLEKIEKSN